MLQLGTLTEPRKVLHDERVLMSIGESVEDVTVEFVPNFTFDGHIELMRKKLGPFNDGEVIRVLSRA